MVSGDNRINDDYFSSFITVIEDSASDRLKGQPVESNSELRVRNFINDCWALKGAFPEDLDEDDCGQLERDQTPSPVKKSYHQLTRNLDNQSNFTKEEFDYPFNAKVILHDIKIFVLRTFVGLRVTSPEDEKDELVNKKIASMCSSWEELKENDDVPYRDTAEVVVGSAKKYTQMKNANASSATGKRIALYSGVFLAVIGRVIQLEPLQWVASAVSAVAVGSLGWGYATNLFNESWVKRSLKRDVDSYIADVQSLERTKSYDSLNATA